MEVHNANTAAPGGTPVFTGWCLQKEDLFVAKLCAFREKDREFVGALIRADLVDRDLIVERLGDVPAQHRTAADRAVEWVLSF